MSSFFTSLGRFTVRFRFLVVLAWIIVTILAVRLLPSLSDVAKDTTSGFLPANTPSMQAAGLAAPFQDASLAAATLVAARDGGLTAEDNAALDKIEQQIRGLDKVKVVADLGVSQDGQARQALVQAAVVAFTGGPEAQSVVDAIRGTFTGPGVPAGLEVHLTGQLATQVDTVAASGSSESTTSLLSLLFIIVLLLLAFRAALAPLVTLLPAAFVLVLAGPVIAEFTKIGVQVSSITQLLLIVLILGAGTDYGVFLVFRVREELRRGLTPHEARRPIGQSRRRVHQLLRFHGHRGAAQPGPRRVRLLPEPRARPRHRHRADAAGGPHACCRPCWRSSVVRSSGPPALRRARTTAMGSGIGSACS